MTLEVHLIKPMDDILKQIKKDFWKKFRYLIPVLAAVFLFTRVFSVDYSRYSHSKSEIRSKLAELESVMELCSQKPDLINHQNQLNQKLDNISGIFYESQDITSAMMDIQELSAKSAAKIISMEPGAAMEEHGLKYYAFRIILRCDFNSAVKFISLIEGYSKFIALESLSMEKEIKGKHLTATINLKVYVR
ncbi:MAG: hypothetical protein ABIA63_13990 [bacterium]